MLFSKRVVLVYTVLVVIPLFLVIGGVTHVLLARQNMRIHEGEQLLFAENVKGLETALNTFDLIESIIASDPELTLFLARPESATENELISTILNRASFLEQVYDITPNIYGIRVFSNSSTVPERWPVFLNSSRIANQNNERFEFDYQASYLGNQNSMQAPSFCTTRKFSKGPKNIGYIQISYKMNSVFPYLYDKEDNHNSYLILRKNKEFENFDVIKKSLSYDHIRLQPKELKSLTKYLFTTTETKGSISFGTFNKYICWEYIPGVDVYLIQISSNRNVRVEFVLIVVFVCAAFALISIALYFVIKYTTSHLMSGIYSVMDGMRQVKDGNLSVQIPITGIDEVSDTQATFNSMTKQLVSQIQQIKTEQSLIADTEMKAMQNQINAHFLYNVLETIRMQAVLADQDDIAESLQVLGRMMRYCLRWRIHRVSLSQEIEYIQSYIYILNIRNDYVINLIVDIPEELMGIEIPKMTLQPLIENAFVHAIEKEEKDADLRVFSEISPDKSKITLSVQDFGCGMDESQVNNIKKYLDDDTFERDSKGSIGLKNIQQRLTVFYGSDYRIKVQSEVGKGTIISVPVPNKELNSGDNK